MEDAAGGADNNGAALKVLAVIGERLAADKSGRFEVGQVFAEAFEGVCGLDGDFASGAENECLWASFGGVGVELFQGD